MKSKKLDKEVDKLLVVAIIGLIVNIFNFMIFNLNCFKASQHADTVIVIL